MKSRHGILSAILISLVVFLQTYQMYLFHFLTGFENSRSLRLGKPQSRQSKKEQEEDAFSACLMIMDDNAHLIEWLAYHYQALPLRRLIIAVDPRSQTSPTEILNRWDGLMEIAEWSDEDFMPPALISAHHKSMTEDETTKLFRQRQEEFYTRCMARLHHEKKTWVALVDTDEYILPNSNAHEPYRLFGYDDSKQGTDRTVLELLHEAQREHHQGHNEAVFQKLQETPCFPMARLSFGVQESESKEFQKSVPYGFDAAQFQTLRWRWHAGRTNKKTNKISKSIIDVSRVDPSLFVPTEQVMVHIPVKEYCDIDGGGIQHLWILNVMSPLVVHHYAGTWEQWTHRKDTRGKRTRAAYETLMYTKQADDSIRRWLENLIRNVGYWKTRDLLRQVGQV
jgi:hypothetical protein